MSAEAHLLEVGADLSALARISSIVGQWHEVVDRLDNIASDEPMSPEKGWVYALFADDGSVLYVGKTAGPLAIRMRQHAKMADEPHWRRCRALGLRVDWVAAWNVGDQCDRLEKAVILALQPPMNTKGLR